MNTENFKKLLLQANISEESAEKFIKALINSGDIGENWGENKSQIKSPQSKRKQGKKQYFTSNLAHSENSYSENEYSENSYSGNEYSENSEENSELDKKAMREALLQKREFAEITARCEECGEVKLYKSYFSGLGYDCAKSCLCDRKNRIKAKLKRFESLSIMDRNSRSDIFKNAKIVRGSAEFALYQQIKLYVKNFDKALELNEGLLFTGACGTGKTFLANCICNYLTEKNYTVLTLKLADYFRLLREDFETKTCLESKMLNAVGEADLVFIDDVGSEQLSEDWGKEKLFSLIDTRYASQKPLLITTNMSPKELLVYLRFHGTDKIFDRIKQMTKSFEFKWCSKRVHKAETFWA